MSPLKLLRPLTSPPQGEHKGSILFIALWSIFLLASFAVILGSEVRMKSSLVKRLEERDKLYLIAEAGIKKAIMQLSKEEKKDYSSLKDAWSSNPAEFKDICLGEGKFNVSYDFQDQSGKNRTMWGMVDEDRKINLNLADLNLLSRLIQITLNLDEAEARDLAACVIDWRDSDNITAVPSGGAENFYYEGLKFPYKTKNAPIEVLDELLLVKGITPEVFSKIKDYITIYGQGRININTASRCVLLAMGLNDYTADKILSYRNGQDKIEGTEDDNFFLSTIGIAPAVKKLYPLNEAEIAQINEISERYLTTVSEFFLVKSTAEFPDKHYPFEIICIVNRQGNILYWHET